MKLVEKDVIYLWSNWSFLILLVFVLGYVVLMRKVIVKVVYVSVRSVLSG